MKKPPTDRDILSAIYDKYYDDFCAYSEDTKSRSSKIHVPIDCEEIAKKLKVDGDIVFGRLYYHLEKKHGYTQTDGAKVSLFSMKTGEDRHTVNFPLLSALVAEQHTSWFRFNLPILISSFALLISILKG
jgi:hypothetical protein